MFQTGVPRQGRRLEGSILSAIANMFRATFSSLSNRQPHLQTWVRVDRDFLTVLPQAEHFWDSQGGH